MYHEVIKCRVEVFEILEGSGGGGGGKGGDLGGGGDAVGVGIQYEFSKA